MKPTYLIIGLPLAYILGAYLLFKPQDPVDKMVLGESTSTLTITPNAVDIRVPKQVDNSFYNLLKETATKQEQNKTTMVKYDIEEVKYWEKQEGILEQDAEHNEGVEHNPLYDTDDIKELIKQGRELSEITRKLKMGYTNSNMTIHEADNLTTRYNINLQKYRELFGTIKEDGYKKCLKDNSKEDCKKYKP